MTSVHKVYMESVYSPFSRQGWTFVLHGVLMKSIGAEFLTGCSPWRQEPVCDAVSNSSKSYILTSIILRDLTQECRINL